MTRVIHSLSDLVTGTAATGHRPLFRETDGWSTVEDDAVDVRAFGPVGEGEDDTAYLNDAFASSTLAYPKHIGLPPPEAGFYKITEPIDIPFAPGTRISGAGRGPTVIKQFSANTPIIRAATDLTHSVTMSDLYLSYNTNQSAAQTDAYGIQWFLSAGSGNGFFSWVIERVNVSGAAIGIGSKSVGQIPPWGLTVSDCGIFHSSINGIKIGGDVAIGVPNVTLRNLYITNTGGSVVPTGAAITLSSAEATLDNIDIEGWTGNLIAVTGNLMPVLIRNLHIENCTWTESAHILYIANGGAILEMANVAGSVTGAGVVVDFLTADAGGNVRAEGIYLGVSVGAGATFKGFHAGSGSPEFWLRQIVDGTSGAGTRNVPYDATASATVAAMRQLDRTVFVPTSAKTTAYTATVADDVLTCDATGGAFTLTLPAAASCTGKQLTIKRTNSGANAVTVDGNASETIDGATSKSLDTQYASVVIVSNGTGWDIAAQMGTVS